MSDIFISYSSHDRVQAISLADKLRALGYDPWIDQHQIHGSARWGKEIVQAINTCSLVAVLVSSSSLESENVVKELSLAAERRKHLLPIMLEEIELTEEFAYHLTGLNRVEIENTDSIVKALEQLKIRSASSDTLIRPSPNTPSTKDIRLAILPFDDLSKEHDNEWFADGMLDELITTLGALEHMKVPSRTDVMYYKKHHPRAQEIASDLNVRYLVGGSVRKAGNKIRITASLTDSFANQQLWTSNYDGNFDDIFELQERVSKEITATLKLRLTPQEKKKIEEQPTENAEAYELYLKGNEQLHRATRGGYEKAIKLFETAIELDPKFTDALLQMSSAYVTYYRECNRQPKWLERANETLKKVEQIIGETGKTLWIHGQIAWQQEDLVQAENILLHASKIDPDYAEIFDMLGNVYLRYGKFKEAVLAFEKSLRLTPNHAHYFNLLVALSILNDIDKIKIIAEEALPVIEKFLLRNDDDLFWRVSYAYTLHWAERNEDAIKEANILAERNDIDGMALFNLGSLFDKLGQPLRDLEMLRRSIDKGYRDIEAFRDYTFDDPEHIQQMELLIQELERIIEKEKNNINAAQV